MLAIQNVSKKFYRHTAVDDVSFQIDFGKITGLLGPNGAGKTTLIRMMNQILEPDKGSIEFKNKELTREDVRLFGYLPEERGLYNSMKVKNHCLFIAKIKGMKTAEANKSINEWFDKFEINDWRNKKVGELSKGMAQKIQFINTVLHNPEVLILDEPFSGFDPVNARLIEEEILRFRSEGKMVIISSHDMNSVDTLCEDAVIMNESKMVANDSIQNLKSSQKSGLYEMIFTGSLMGFVNSLWAGYELVDKQDLGGERNKVILKMRRDNEVNDLLNTVMGVVKIESMRLIQPTMKEVFISLMNDAEGGSFE
jgi:ABC-2 type transport system ATP-binding protein